MLVECERQPGGAVRQLVEGPGGGVELGEELEAGGASGIVYGAENVMPSAG